MFLCVCVRLKSVIASDNQENDKSGNSAFFQILISFYIQSEVLSLSVCLPSIPICLSPTVWK